jgi:hypothetical protein
MGSVYRFMPGVYICLSSTKGFSYFRYFFFYSVVYVEEDTLL